MMKNPTNLDAQTEQIAYDVIGAAMEVHRTLRPGLLEQIYEDALCIELEERGIVYERQKPVGIWYKGRSIGDMRLDILVADRVIVELKSVERLEPVHTAQVLTYLKVTQKRLGLLVNFNVSILKNGIKRIVL